MLQSASARIAENINWRTVEFVLENVVFLLIGLQLQQILDGVRGRHLAAGTIIGVCSPCWPRDRGAAGLGDVGRRGLQDRHGGACAEPPWGWAGGASISWAGMRGVVTLAAVFLLPAATPNRDLLRLAAFTVVVGTLLVQGLSLPWLIRRLRLPAPDPAEDALQAASLITESTRAGLARLDEIAGADDPPEVLEQLRRRAATRSNVAWERLGRPFDEYEPPAVIYQRLRLQMLAAERDAILGRARRRAARRRDAALGAERDGHGGIAARAHRRRRRTTDAELDAGAPARAECEHLLAAPRVAVARTPGPVRGLPARGHDLGAPADVPDLRAGRLLRLLGRQPRDQALPRRPAIR